MIFGTHIHQDQFFAGDAGFIVFLVVKNASVISCPHNGGIAYVFGLVLFVNVLVDPLHFHFRHAWLHGFHYLNLGLARDQHGLAEQFQFFLGFYGAQVGHNGPQVVGVQVIFLGLRRQRQRWFVGIMGLRLELLNQVIQIGRVGRLIADVIFEVEEQDLVEF